MLIQAHREWGSDEETGEHVSRVARLWRPVWALVGVMLTRWKGQRAGGRVGKGGGGGRGRGGWWNGKGGGGRGRGDGGTGRGVVDGEGGDGGTGRGGGGRGRGGVGTGRRGGSDGRGRRGRGKQPPTWAYSTVITVNTNEIFLFVGWLLNVPATCECISGTEDAETIVRAATLS